MAATSRPGMANLALLRPGAVQAWFMPSIFMRVLMAMFLVAALFMHGTSSIQKHCYTQALCVPANPYKVCLILYDCQCRVFLLAATTVVPFYSQTYCHRLP